MLRPVPPQSLKLVLKQDATKEANKRVAAIPGISGRDDGELIVGPQHRRKEVTPTATPIDTLVNTAVDGIPTSEADFAAADELENALQTGFADFEVDGPSSVDDVGVLEAFDDEEDLFAGHT